MELFKNFYKNLGIDANATTEEKREAIAKRVNEIFPTFRPAKKVEVKPAEKAEEKAE